MIVRAVAAVVLFTGLSGCAPMTPEQAAAFEAQERDRARDCGLRGGWYVSGSCVSRGGGA